MVSLGAVLSKLTRLLRLPVTTSYLDWSPQIRTHVKSELNPCFHGYVAMYWRGLISKGIETASYKCGLILATPQPLFMHAIEALLVHVRRGPLLANTITHAMVHLGVGARLGLQRSVH